MEHQSNKSLSMALEDIIKDSKYLPFCKSGHKILFNFKGDNPKAGYCEECDQWFMVVEVSENTVDKFGILDSVDAKRR